MIENPLVLGWEHYEFNKDILEKYLGPTEIKIEIIDLPMERFIQIDLVNGRLDQDSVSKKPFLF